MDDWNPLAEDFVDESFNSYIRGPAKGLVSKGPYTRGGTRHIQLYVTGIPNELAETGLMNLFSRHGLVIRAKKIQSTRVTGDTYGFVTMSSLADAERAIRELDKFKIDRFILRVSVALSEEERKKRTDQKRFEQTLLDIDNEDDSDSAGESSHAKTNGFGKTPEPPKNPQPVGRGHFLKGVNQDSLLPTPRAPGGYPHKVGPSGDSHPHQPMTSTPSPSSKLHIDVNSNRVDALNVTNIETMSQLHTPVGRGSAHDHTRSGYGSDGQTDKKQYPSVGRGAARDSWYDFNTESGYTSDYPSSRTRTSGRGAGGRGAARDSFHSYKESGYTSEYPSSQMNMSMSRGGHRDSNMNQSFRGHRGRGGGRGAWKNRGGGMGRGYPMQYPPPMYGPGVVYVDPYTMMGPGMMGPGMMGPGMMAPGMNPHLLQPVYPNMINPALMAQVTPKPKPPKEPEEKGLAQECSVCSKLGSLRCSRCKTPYCSAKCQISDWSQHKAICKALAKDAELSEAFESKFDVTVGDELIPQVQGLMEQAIGEPLKVTVKEDSKKVVRKFSDKTNDVESETCVQETKNVNPKKTSDARAARTTAASGNELPKGKVCFNCQSKTHMRNECPKPANFNLQCFNCNMKGHASRDCPEKEILCYNCRGYGHLSKECPVKGKDDSSGRNDARMNDTAARSQKGSSPQYDAPGKKGDQPVSQNKGQPRSPQGSSNQLAGSVPPRTSSSCPVPPQSKVEAKLPPRKKIAGASLNIGEEAQVVITMVTNPAEIYVQIVHEENIRPLADIMQAMTTKYPSMPCDVTSVMVGEFYAAMFSQDQTWYRAQVMQKHGNDIVIQFVDFGNQETTSLDHLRRLEPSMAGHPTQAVLVSLDRISPVQGGQWNVSDQDLNKYLTPDRVPYKAVCHKVVERPSGRLHMVTLSTPEGKDVASQLVDAGLAITAAAAATSGGSVKTVDVSRPADSVETVADSGPMLARNILTVTSTLKVGQEIPVLITEKTSPITFSIQVPNIDIIQAFLEFNAKFNQIYVQEKASLYRPQLTGELVASAFSGEEGWYRAEVLQIHDATATVLFLDYGNTETVPFTGLRKAKPFCSSLPLQGVQCQLADVEKPVGGWPQGAVELLDQHCEGPLKGLVKGIQDVTVVLELQASSGELLCEIIKKYLQSAQAPVDVGVKLVQTVSPTVHIESMKIPITDDKVDAVIMDVTSLNMFYVQIATEEVQLQLASLMTELNQACVEARACDVEVGSYVAAQFCDGESTLWYRGHVMQKSDKLTVFFIDYGNTDLVSLQMVTRLEDTFMTVPAMAINCCLEGSERAVGDALMQLKQLTNVAVKIKAVVHQQEQFSVKVYHDQIELNSVLCPPNQVKTQVDVPAMVTPTKRETVSATPTSSSTSAFKCIEASKLPQDGSLVDAVIMDVSSLDKFYVQIATEEVQLQLAALMTELNQACVEARACAVEVGSYVAAQFCDGESTLWYRGHVIQKSDKLTVFFIDYGNTDLVSLQMVTHLEDKFMTVPAMAINCGLEGSERAVGDALMQLKQLTNVAVKIKAVACEQQRNTVKVYHDQIELNSVLCPQNQVKAQVGVPAMVTPTKRETVAATPTSTSATKCIEASKLPQDGSLVDAVLMDVSSLDKFYVQIGTEEVQLQLAALMTELNQACVEAHACDVEVGSYVAAQFCDGESTLWYRGLVMQKSDKLSVFFIDYGNTDLVSLQMVTRLEDTFMTVPAMAINCGLEGSERAVGDALLQLKQLTNVAVKIKAVACEQQRNIVKVYHDQIELNSVLCPQNQVKTKDVPAMGTTTKRETVSAKPTSPSTSAFKCIEASKLPQDGSLVDAVIMDVSSLDKFYVQIATEEVQLQLASLMTELNQACVEARACAVEVGSYVAAQFCDGESTLWYRGHVMQKSDKLTIFFIDYGNTDLVSLQMVTRLEDKFMTVPAMAINCGLEGSERAVGDALIQLKQLTNVAFKIKAVACEQHRNIVKVYHDQIELNSVLCPQNQVKTQVDVPAMVTPTKRETVAATSTSATKCIEASKLPQDGSLVDAVIMDVSSLDKFYVQIATEEVQLQLAALMTELNQACAEARACDVEVGSYVAAQFCDGESTLWYRGHVMQRSDNLTVFFIDYGNTDLVPLQMVTRLEDKFMSVPAMAINCGLEGSERAVGDALMQLKQLTNVAVKIKAVACEQQRHIVKVYHDQIELNSVLCPQNQVKTQVDVPAMITPTKRETVAATPTSTSATKYIEASKLPQDGSLVDAVIMDVSSLDKFHVQIATEEVQLQLASLMTELNQACVEAGACDVEVGSYVAAQFCDGESTLWYRGHVMQKSDKLSIFFIDYGNTDLVSLQMVTRLEDKFMTVPAMAINCGLEGSERAVGDALIQLKQLTNVAFKIKAVACEQQRNIVKVYHDQIELNSVLCPQNQVKTQEDVPAMVTPTKRETVAATSTSATKCIEASKLPQDGSLVDVVIMDVSSLDKFYVQIATEEVQLQLAALMTELNQACAEARACDVEVGSYVAAQFCDGESTLWYRGHVMQRSDNLTVFFIDYGNTDLVPLQMVTRLEDKFMSVPAMAINCGLEGSERAVGDALMQLKQLTNVAVKIKAVACEQQRHIVKVYHDQIELNTVLCPLAPSVNIATDEKQQEAAAHTMAAIKPTELSLDGSRVQSAPVFIVSPASFYIQLTDGQRKEELATMMKELNEHCLKDSNSYRPCLGEYVSALFIENGEATGWYRARVEQLTSDQEVKVFFVDYGNTEIVYVSSIRKLPKTFRNLPAFGVHCCLLGGEAANEDAKSEMNVLMNHELFTEALQRDGDLYTVKLYLTDPDQTCVNTVLGLNLSMDTEPEKGVPVQSEAPAPVQHAAATCELNGHLSLDTSMSTALVDSLPKLRSPPAVGLPRKKTSSPISGERKAVFVGTLRKNHPKTQEFKAIISSVVRPNLFHCQLFEDPTILQELKVLSETMKVECGEDTGIDHSLEQGELCCALFPDDGEWYRAMIKEIFPDKTAKVWYVDFGNETDVPLHLLRPATEHYTQLPLQAFRCSLNGVVPVGGTWTDAAKAKMSEFMSQPLVASIQEEDKDMYSVTLKTMTGDNISDLLIKAGYAKAAETQGTDEKDLLMRENEMLEKRVKLLEQKLASRK